MLVFNFPFFRFIIHSDDNNPFLKPLEEFIKEVKLYKPDLLVIAGLQMLDSFPFESGLTKIPELV